MKKLSYILIALSFIFCRYSFANCNGQNAVSTINFGNILIQRDVPVGTVIASKGFTTSGYLMDCPSGTGADYLDYLMEYGELVSGAGNTDVNSLYSTNLAGVGIRAYFTSRNTYFSRPAHAAGPYANGYVNGGTIIVDLVKTGDITPGSLTTAAVGHARVRSNNSLGLTLNMASGNSVEVAACSVLTSVVNVPLGNYVTTEFSSVGHTTTAKDVPVSLDCGSGARINVLVTAGADTDTTQQGVIKLSSGTNSASGVAVQLLDKNGQGVKLNQKFVVDTITADGQYNFNWTARYMQTKSLVTTGDANATATLALTYE